MSNYSNIIINTIVTVILQLLLSAFIDSLVLVKKLNCQLNEGTVEPTRTVRVN